MQGIQEDHKIKTTAEFFKILKLFQNEQLDDINLKTGHEHYHPKMKI